MKGLSKEAFRALATLGIGPNGTVEWTRERIAFEAWQRGYDGRRLRFFLEKETGCSRETSLELWRATGPEARLLEQIGGCEEDAAVCSCSWHENKRAALSSH